MGWDSMKKKRYGFKISCEQPHDGKMIWINAADSDKTYCKKRSHDEKLILVRKSNSIAVKSARGVINPRSDQRFRVVTKTDGIRTARGIIKPIKNKAVRGKPRVNRKAYGGGRNKPDFGD